MITNVKNVSKRFGGLVALDDVSIHVKKGEIVGLIGPNGAGKTTLFNSIAGAFGVTSGTIEFLGKDITKMRANDRCKLGIGRTFQITKPFGNMTVLENVSIGALYGKNEKINKLSTAAKEKSLAEAEEILEFMQLVHKKDVRADTLNVPERKRLEICRALAAPTTCLARARRFRVPSLLSYGRMTMRRKTISRRTESYCKLPVNQCVRNMWVVFLLPTYSVFDTCVKLSYHCSG